MAMRPIALSILLVLSMSVFCASSSELILSDQCPASFEKTAQGTCQLRTLYDFYDSPADHGGLRARLPQVTRNYTPQQIDLGRYLFFDPVLSAKQDMACASCHQPSKGLADGRARALGARQPDGRRTELPRGAPALWNVAFLQRLMWDGSAADLASQAQRPLFAPQEMGNTAQHLETSLNQIPEYRALFEQAFGRPPSVETVTEALAAFQSSLVSFNSRYDRYVHGDTEAINAQEVRGYNIFRGFVARCSQCHVPPLFTDSELAVIGAPNAADGAFDAGAGSTSKDPNLLGAFRVPTLRNITRSAPYFHAGQFKTLGEVVHFYNDTRGHAAPKDAPLKLHWQIHMTRGPQLSLEEEHDIVAFLNTLEDELMLPAIPAAVPSGLPVTTDLNPESL
ncbi:cytochrome-c peroxidase [Pseudomonas veronii]|uniref:cytochrome-c peroxidase n=1 Tax=Pseudomonas veronii TaxID=76761 RepID=UPI0021BE24C8|nr:cytochrome c peroxidase [Pseudomonas veronii]MCT9826655.1 hypothetical protein [Pseudomonas veronii]